MVELRLKDNATRDPDNTGLRVLVVEDDANARTAMVDYLSSVGCSVVAAGSGEEAISLGQRCAPQLLLCDWMLETAIDGITVARTLAASLTELRIVFVTAFGLEELARRTRDLPVTAILEKPVRLQQIRQYINP